MAELLHYGDTQKHGCPSFRFGPIVLAKKAVKNNRKATVRYFFHALAYDGAIAGVRNHEFQ